MKIVKIEKVCDNPGMESNVPIGFESVGITEGPVIGERFRVGEFETGVVLRIEGDKLFTKKSEFKLEVIDEMPIGKKEPHEKVNNIFEDIHLKPSSSLSESIGMDRDAVANFADKVGKAVTMHPTPVLAIEWLLPRMTKEEVVFAVGNFMADSLKKIDRAGDVASLPQKLQDLLRKLKEGGKEI